MRKYIDRVHELVEMATAEYRRSAMITADELLSPDLKEKFLGRFQDNRLQSDKYMDELKALDHDLNEEFDSMITADEHNRTLDLIDRCLAQIGNEFLGEGGAAKLTQRLDELVATELAEQQRQKLRLLLGAAGVTVEQASHMGTLLGAQMIEVNDPEKLGVVFDLLGKTPESGESSEWSSEGDTGPMEEFLTEDTLHPDTITEEQPLSE